MIDANMLSHRPPRPAAIDAVAQFLAGLEEWHRLLVHRHRLAGTRVPPGAGIAPLDGEGAEAAQLHPCAARQRAGDLIENRRHDQLDIGSPQMRVAGGKFRDELRLGHDPGSRVSVQPPKRCQTSRAPSRITPWENRLFHNSSNIHPRLPVSARLAKPLVETSSTGRSAETSL